MMLPCIPRRIISNNLAALQSTAHVYKQNVAVCTSPTPKPPSAVTPSQSVSSAEVRGSSPVGHRPEIDA